MRNSRGAFIKLIPVCCYNEWELGIDLMEYKDCTNKRFLFVVWFGKKILFIGSIIDGIRLFATIKNNPLFEKTMRIVVGSAIWFGRSIDQKRRMRCRKRWY